MWLLSLNNKGTSRSSRFWFTVYPIGQQQVRQDWTQSWIVEDICQEPCSGNSTRTTLWMIYLDKQFAVLFFGHPGDWDGAQQLLQTTSIILVTESVKKFLICLDCVPWKMHFWQHSCLSALNVPMLIMPTHTRLCHVYPVWSHLENPQIPCGRFKLEQVVATEYSRLWPNSLTTDQRNQSSRYACKHMCLFWSFGKTPHRDPEIVFELQLSCTKLQSGSKLQSSVKWIQYWIEFIASVLNARVTSWSRDQTDHHHRMNRSYYWTCQIHQAYYSCLGTVILLFVSCFQRRAAQTKGTSRLLWGLYSRLFDATDAPWGNTGRLI